MAVINSFANSLLTFSLFSNAQCQIESHFQAHHDEGVHFILGCANFWPLENKNVEEFAKAYFTERFRQGQPVGISRAETEDFVKKAQAH